MSTLRNQSALLLLLSGIAGPGLASGCGRDTHPVATHRSNDAKPPPVTGLSQAPAASDNSSATPSPAPKQSSPSATAKPTGNPRPNEHVAAPATKNDDPPVDKNRLRNITFDSLKFEMEKAEKFEREMLSPAIEKLDGQRIRIKGYMLPTSLQSGLTRFILVRDNLECCFGPGAALFDSVAVNMADGETTKYSYPPIAIEGTFRIHLVENPFFNRPSPPGRPKENSHMSIFKLEDAMVR